MPNDALLLHKNISWSMTMTVHNKPWKNIESLQVLGIIKHQFTHWSTYLICAISIPCLNYLSKSKFHVMQASFLLHHNFLIWNKFDWPEMITFGGINWPKFGRMLTDLNQTCIKMKSCQIFYVVFIAFCIADSMSFKLGKTSVRASCPPKPTTVSELDTQKVTISSTFQWNKIFFDTVERL